MPGPRPRPFSNAVLLKESLTRQANRYTGKRPGPCTNSGRQARGTGSTSPRIGTKTCRTHPQLEALSLDCLVGVISGTHQRRWSRGLEHLKVAEAQKRSFCKRSWEESCNTANCCDQLLRSPIACLHVAEVHLPGPIRVQKSALNKVPVGMTRPLFEVAKRGVSKRGSAVHPPKQLGCNSCNVCFVVLLPQPLAAARAQEAEPKDIAWVRSSLRLQRTDSNEKVKPTMDSIKPDCGQSPAPGASGWRRGWRPPPRTAPGLP